MIATFLIRLIQIYQRTQPFRNVLYVTIGISPHACRHQPTCSQYAITAIKRYGTIQGSFLACKRLSSCHPFAKNYYQ